jgi:hypothetical protein
MYRAASQDTLSLTNSRDVPENTPWCFGSSMSQSGNPSNVSNRYVILLRRSPTRAMTVAEFPLSTPSSEKSPDSFLGNQINDQTEHKETRLVQSIGWVVADESRNVFCWFHFSAEVYVSLKVVRIPLGHKRQMSPIRDVRKSVAVLLQRFGIGRKCGGKLRSQGIPLAQEVVALLD